MTEKPTAPVVYGCPEDEIDDDHPIIKIAVDLLEVDNESYVLRDDGMEALCGALDPLVGTWDLPLAVSALMRLAHVLESSSNSPQAAYALCEVIERDNVVDGLKAIVQEARDQLEGGEATAAAAKPFKEFSDAKEEKTAPKVGDDAPDGAVKLDAFKAPRRV